MLRKMLVSLISLFLVGCAAERPYSASTYGDSELVGLRLGVRATKNNEVGIVAERLNNEEDRYGVYGKYHFDETVDILNPLSQEEMIEATSYIGIQTMFENDVVPFIGFIFNPGSEEAAVENGGLFIEYQNGTLINRDPTREHIFRAGLTFRF